MFTIALLAVFSCTILTVAAQCPDNSWQTYNGNCYKAFKADVTANEARKACQALGGGADLCSIGDEGEDQFIRGMCVNQEPEPPASPSTRCVHIGLSIERDQSGAVSGSSWNDGSEVKYGCPKCTGAGNKPWADGGAWNGPKEPKNEANAKCCALMYNTKCAGDWAAQDCDGPKGGYVCKIRGSNPPSTIKCRGGYTAFNGKCYRVYTNQQSTVATSKSTCQGDGGNLVTIHSEAENIFVIGLISQQIPGPPTSPNYMRIFNGMEATRAANADIASLRWADGTNVDYGNPQAPGFQPGTAPWSDGKAYGGVVEPKRNVPAVNGFMVKNNLIAGGWCLGPLNEEIGNTSFFGAFCCETKPI